MLTNKWHADRWRLKKGMPFYKIPVLLCNHSAFSVHIHYCLVWLNNQTGQEQIKMDRTAKRIIGAKLPSIQEMGRKLQINHILDTTYSNLSPLVGTTEHHMPALPDTKTFFSHRPSNNSAQMCHHTEDILVWHPYKLHSASLQF